MVLCFTIILGVFFVFLFFHEKGLRIKETDEMIMQILHGRSAQVDAVISGLEEQGLIFSMLPEINNLDPEVLPEFLADLEMDDLIKEIAVIPRDGTLFIPNLHRTDLDLKTRPYYQGILEEDRDFFLSAFHGTQGYPVLAISLPVTDLVTGERKAVMNVSLNLNDFSIKVSDDIAILGGSGYIFDKNGNMITNRNADYILNLDMTAENNDWPELAGLVSAAKAESNGIYSYVDENGVPIVSYFTEISFNPDWILAVNVPLKNIMKPVHRLLVSLGIGIVIVLGVLITIIWIVLRIFVIKPVHSMTDMLKAIAGGGGDLTGRINVGNKKGKGDEITRMAGYFNDFIGSLNKMIVDLKNASRDNRLFADVLASNTTEISSSSLEMSATTKSISEQVTQLTERIGESAVKVKNIKEQIQQVNSNIDDEAAFITESSSAITEMVASIQNLSRISTEKQIIINDLADNAQTSGQAMEETAREIIEISNSVDTIVELVDVINDVSQRINLLSMNAAIEAAHAGDAGRGFAVVAEEIRKLAEMTNEQSSRISESVTHIAKKIAISGKSSKNTEESISKITSNIQTIAETINEMVLGMTEISEGSKQIIESLESLVSSSQSVRNSSKVVDENSNEVLKDIEEIDRISIRSHEGVEELVVGNNHISQAIGELAEMGEKNNENINVIDRKLDQFKVDE